MMTTVTERCRTVATFRHVSVKLMELLARWTPTTPEMEAKVLFGRHVWDFAQMANWLGERTFELRQAKHFTLRPVNAYQTLLDEASAARSTGERVATLYEGLLPGLVGRYRRYVAETDPILDEPSVVIIERIVKTLERQRDEAGTLCTELHLDARVAGDIAARERDIGNIVEEQARA